MLAPRRTFLGIGTGHTAMRVMGQDPMPVKEFREYLRVVRTMLKGENVDYTYRDKTTEIAWQHHAAGIRNTYDKVPIYVAANGPLALRAAGAYGDGLISIFNEHPEMMKANLDLCRAGAEKVGRTLGDDFHTTSLCHAVVLRPGETLRLEIQMQRLGSRMGTATGTASVDGAVACTVTITFVIPPESALPRPPGTNP